MPRQIKKTIIKYQNNPTIQKQNKSLSTHQQLKDNNTIANQEERQRSRQKSNIIVNQNKTDNTNKQVTVDVNSRKARLQAMKKARQLKQKEQQQGMNKKIVQGNQNINDKDKNNLMDDQKKQIKIVVVNELINYDKNTQQVQAQLNNLKPEKNDLIHQNPSKQFNVSQKAPNNYLQPVKKQQNSQQQQQNSQQQQQTQQKRVLSKPVFLSKNDRQRFHQDQQLQKKRQQQRKKKNLRYTTKILLEENIKNQMENNSDQEIDNMNDDDETNLPDDSDDKNQQLQYQMWKIRQLKRIRRDREIRQKHLLQKTQIQRRRQMNNEQILLENRLLGSDSTQNDTQTKYVFMQKYYHKGAFYQDSNDPIFNRDYNLPTPMQMQDKSALPGVLQKRKGNFGKKGQSKYTHLTAEDTTDTNPLTRADESLLNSWKKKMAGYKK